MRKSLLIITVVGLLAGFAFANLTGFISDSYDYNADGEYPEHFFVAREDSLHRRMTLDPVTQEIVCEYTAWWYWSINPHGPHITGSVSVLVNGIPVRDAEFSLSASKPMLPNVTFNHRVAASELQPGWNTVVFRASLPNFDDGDFWFIEMQVYKQ